MLLTFGTDILLLNLRVECSGFSEEKLLLRTYLFRKGAFQKRLAGFCVPSGKLT